MKRITGLCLAAAGAVALLALPACGSADVEYALSENGEYYIVSGVSGSKMALTSFNVPAQYTDVQTGVTAPVKEIGDEAFYGCAGLYSITLPDTIERIGVRAFMLCGFDSIELPDSLTTIAYGAFGMCQSLTEITIPESVTEIDYCAFYACTSLKVAYVKANISDLKALTFANSVVTSGSNVYTSTSLTTLYLPSSLEKINSTSFEGNYITDIYFGGDEDDWANIFFYETVQDEESGEKTDQAIDSSDLLSAVTLHYSVNF